MKKLSFLFISFVSVLNISAAVYSGSCGANANYYLDTETGLISITGTGDMYDYASSSFMGMTVPWGSYSMKHSIKTIEIADGITSVGSYSFESCENATSVTIGNTVSRIGDNAFSRCTSLNAITLPDALTSIGKYAFSNCTNITSVTIPKNVRTLNERAFYYCTKLETATIENGLTNIGNYAFNSCYNMKEVSIPNSVVSIGESAFYRCLALTSVSLPINLESIGNNAFQSCTGLSDITLPSSIQNIGNSAFAGCYNFNRIEIPANVVYIGSSAFYGCFVLHGQFTNNSSLDEIDNKYWGCRMIDSRDNGFYIATDTLVRYVGEAAEVVIPDIVTVIDDYAFDGSYHVTSVTLPENLKSIGNTAMGGLDIKSLDFPNSLEFMGEYAVYKTSLSSIKIPTGMTTIEKYTFYSCREVKEIEIHGGVENIKNYAFGMIDDVENIYNYALTPQDIERGVFSCYTNATLHVVKGYKSVYEAADNWKDFTIVDDLEDTTDIITIGDDCKSKGVKAVKYISNGNIIILKEGNKYSSSGALLK